MIITRGANTYGPGQHPEKFLPRMFGCAALGRPLPLYGDGRQQRDWLQVEDHVSGLLAAFERGEAGEVYNLGAGRVQSNREILRLMLEKAGMEGEWVSVEDRPGHDRRYAMDSGKAERMLGWRPEMPLERGMEEMVGWLRKNQGWWRERLPEGGGWSDGA